MSHQKPSVGRVVHYCEKAACHAALITEVHSDHCVNLAVFALTGNACYGRQSVELHTGELGHPSGEGRWTWPVFVPPAKAPEAEKKAVDEPSQSTPPKAPEVAQAQPEAPATPKKR